MIKVDEKEFFKEVVVRLTSSLNINKAIFSLSEYLRKYMKVIDFELYIPMEVSGQFRKIIYYSSGHSSDGTSWLPQNYWNWLKQQRTPFLLRDTDKNRFVDELTTIIELKGFSTLISPLLIEDKPIGYILIRVEGENEFPSSIISLMAVATKPFSIILANGIADNLIKQHRNLFVSDKQSVHNALSVNPKIEIVGENSGLKNVLEMVRKVAQKKTTVLLQGETGTGKEVIVSAIHHMSSTPNGPFIKLNCGAIPENLIESELFGHEKGAFTGASCSKKGYFERANGGTLFLDEIGEMPHCCQVKLLRVLQNKEAYRVGGEKSFEINTRIVAATNRNLEEMVKRGEFREDLWYRLNVYLINIPPLKERVEDIPELVHFFVNKISNEMEMAAPPILKVALDKLKLYSWPGNVRELENVVERELIQYSENTLNFKSFIKEKLTSTSIDYNIDSAEVENKNTMDLEKVMSLHISKVLDITGGKIHGAGGAAELLNINPNTLRARMKKLGIL